VSGLAVGLTASFLAGAARAKGHGLRTLLQWNVPAEILRCVWAEDLERSPFTRVSPNRVGTVRNGL
jgi:hypothetical protein